MSSLNDGMGFEEVMSSDLVTSSQNGYFTLISGTNVQGNVISGASARLGATTFTGALTLSSTVSGVGQFSVVSGADGRFTAVNLAGKALSPAGTGSASLTWGRYIEAGSATLGAGSDLWLVFPTAFTVGPFIQLQSLTTAGNNDLWVSGTRSVGSAYIMGKTASEAFNWLAIG